MQIYQILIYPLPRIQRAITTFLFAIFLFFLIPSKITFWTIVFPLSLIATVYRPIAYIYGPPDYQAMVSAFSTTFSEAKEFLCLIPASLYLKSLLIPVTASIAYYLARLTGIKPWKKNSRSYFFFFINHFARTDFIFPKDIQCWRRNKRATRNVAKVH